MAERFMNPYALLLETEEKLESVPDDRLFNESKYQKLTEQWCAAKFGIGYSKFCRPCEVAVNFSPNRIYADIFLKVSDSVWDFQLAEAQRPGRKRGQIYKQIAKGDTVLQPYEPERGHHEGPDWIAEAVQKKANKRYANSTDLNLLIYMNFNARELEYEKLKESCLPYKNNFSSIWVVSYNLICSVFGNSELGEIPGWGVTSTF